jgi:hypothetical protein
VPRVSFRRSAPLDAAALSARWTAGLDPRPGVEHAHVADVFDDLVDTLAERPADIAGALVRFGARLGTDGWALEDLAKWVTQLAGHAGAVGEALTTFAAGVALATGWADGFLAGSYEDGCTDPLTGLATPAVLALRLRQVYDQCAALGLDPRVAYALLVISVELPARSPLVRDAARVMLADRVAATFATGETACAAGDVICVLAPRTPSLHEAVESLVLQLKDLSVLQGAPLLTWIEDLPADRDQLEAFLDDVVMTR